MQNIFLDIEVYPEWWCVVGKIENRWIVITSETSGWVKSIRSLKFDLLIIGYNIKGYDLRILNGLCDGISPKSVYEISEAIINDTENIYNNYYYWNKFVFLDLYDDFAGSLKEFESNKGMSIRETSVPFGKRNLTQVEKEEIIEYCKHDVEAVEVLFNSRKDYISAKLKLAEMFDINTNTCYKSTNAKMVALILGGEGRYIPQSSAFIIPENVREYVESNVPKDVLKEFEYFKDDDDEDKTVEFNLFGNVVIFGSGGIHSSIGDNIIGMSDENNLLIDIDVTSYYPNLIMKFDYMSRNANNGKLYREIYDLRLKLKSEMNKENETNGKTPLYYDLSLQQNALKLVLNTTYGTMKNKYSKLYDKEMGSSVCYLGQLLLVSLANKLSSCSTVIQTNTDGILIKVSKDNVQQVKTLVEEWESLTDMKMEWDNIKVFVQKDVNNYINIEANGKSKLKGRWGNQADAKYVEQKIPNLNAPITHVALVNYYVNGTPIEDTINNCNNILDFCFTTKMGHHYKKVLHYINDEPVELNKVNRVIATTKQEYGTLKKLKYEDDGTLRYDKISEIPVHSYILNDLPEMIDHLDRQWYIDFTKNKIKEMVIV